MSYLNSKRSESSASRISGDGYTTEDGGDDRDDSKRRSRNLSEKKRRDQFNILINELCSMVSASRKMDKSTVLKATISFLRAKNAQSQGPEPQGESERSFLSNEEFCYLMLEAMDGFIMVISASGKIIYISESVTTLLGHTPSELMSCSMYDLIPTEERTALFNILAGPSEDKLRPDFFVTLNIRQGGLDTHQEDHKYQLVKFNGYYKRLIPHNHRHEDCCVTEDENSGDQKRASPPKEHVLVCTGKLMDSALLRDMSTVVVSSDTEFSSRHSLEWRFLFLDHRAPPLIGYLPFEVLGTSGYDLIHAEDLEKVASCHEELMRKGEGTSCYYRFLTKGQQWIWLQSRFYITHHQWNSKPEFVACTHRVVSYEDVIKDMRGEAPVSSINQDSYLPKPLKMEHRAKSFASSSASGRIRSAGNSECGSVGRKRSASAQHRDREILPKLTVLIDSSATKSDCELFKIEASAMNDVPNLADNMPAIGEQVASGLESNIGEQVEQCRNSVLIQEPSSVTQVDQVHPVPVLSLPLSAFHLHPLQSNNAVSPSYVSQGGLMLAPTQQQLLIKQAELQRQILDQQEELRLVSEQLLIDQTETSSMLIPNSHPQPQIFQPQLHHNLQDVNLVQEQMQQQEFSNFIQYHSPKP